MTRTSSQIETQEAKHAHQLDLDGQMFKMTSSAWETWSLYLSIGVKEAACLLCNRSTAAAAIKSIEQGPLQCAHKFKKHPEYSWPISAACMTKPQGCNCFEAAAGCQLWRLHVSKSMQMTKS